MSFRAILLTMRAIALIVSVGFVLVIGRQYLVNKWALSVPIWIYGVLGLAVLWVVFSLSMRSLLAELRANHPAAAQPLPQRIRSASHAESVHRYPLRLTGTVAVFGLCLVALPFLSASPDSRIAPVTYACSFVGATALFIIAVRLFLYSVTVKQGRIIIRAFTLRQVELAEVAETTMVSTRNGPQIVVSLKNGKVLRFGRLLTGFDDLRASLMGRSTITS